MPLPSAASPTMNEEIDSPNPIESEGDEIHTTPAKSSGKKKRSLLGRLIRTIVFLGLLFLLCLVVAVILGYSKRVELVNSLGQRLELPYDVAVAGLEFEGANRIRIDGVRLTERESGRVILNADQANWLLDLRSVAAGHLGNLEITDGVLSAERADIDFLFPVTEPEISAESSPTSPTEQDPEESRPARLSWDRIVLRNTALSYGGDDLWPASKMILDFEGGRFSLREGVLTCESQDIRFSNLMIGTTDSPLLLDVKESRVRLESADSDLIHISEISANARSLELDLPFLERLAKALDQPAYPEPEHPPALASPPALGGSGVKAPSAIESPARTLPTIQLDILRVYNERFQLRKVGQANLGGVDAGVLVTGRNAVLKNGSLVIEEVGTELNDVVVDLKELGAVKIEQFAAKGDASWGHDERRLFLSEVEIESPDIDLDLTRPSETGAKSPAVIDEQSQASSEAIVLPTVSFAALAIRDGALKIKGSREASIPDCVANFDLTLADWAFTGGDLKFPESQQVLDVGKLDYRFPGYGEAAILAEGVSVTIEPAVFMDSGKVKSLSAEALAVRLDKSTFAMPEPSPTTTTSPVPIFAAPELWKFANLTIKEGNFSMGALVPEMPLIETKFSLHTPSTIEGTYVTLLAVNFSDVALRTAAESDPFYRTKEISVDVDYAKVWTGGGLENISLSGGVLEVGEELIQFASGDGKEDDLTKQPSDPATAEGLPDFKSLIINDTQVVLRDVAPGLPTVVFGLEKREGIQRVEIVNLEIPSPYNPLIPVAVLDTIFVEFTIAGLLEQHIDRVEIVNPTIYVGEHLFWYVEHYRKFLDTDAEAEEDVADEVIAEGEEAKVVEEKGWDIGALEAHNGKIVVAPKGTPLPGFEIPFPFSCYTELGSGVVEANLAIQEGDYPLPEIELMLEKLSGSVTFNLPFKQIDNNLVEVLQAKRIRFKQFVGDNPYVSITYDQHGIYIHFGADAYGGYVEGEVNAYIDENYTWDGWVAGSDVDTGALTEVLTPEYFSMTGIADFSIIANGNMDELFQAVGSFGNKSDGKIDIRALEGIAGDLEDPDPIVAWLAEGGIDALQNFRYEKAVGKFSIYGQEGELDFDLIGPDGIRDIEIVVHDHRPSPPLKSSNRPANAPAASP